MPSKITAHVLKYAMTAIIALTTICSTAQAEDQSSGCGMGWKVAPRNSLLSSTTRSFVNLTFSNTIGMTSGTSGCSKHSIVKKEKEAMYFAETNQGQLMIEMAQGQGENLRGLAAIMGCLTSGIPAFEKAVQNNYNQVFPTSETTPAKMLEGVRSVIGSDQTAARQCGFTG